MGSNLDYYSQLSAPLALASFRDLNRSMKPSDKTHCVIG